MNASVQLFNLQFTPGVANALFNPEQTCNTMYFAIHNLYADFLSRQKPKHIIGKQYMEDTIREIVIKNMDELNPHLRGKYTVTTACKDDFATGMEVTIELIPALEDLNEELGMSVHKLH